MSGSIELDQVSALKINRDDVRIETLNLNNKSVHILAKVTFANTSYYNTQVTDNSGSSIQGQTRYSSYTSLSMPASRSVPFGTKIGAQVATATFNNPVDVAGTSWGTDTYALRATEWSTKDDLSDTFNMNTPLFHDITLYPKWYWNATSRGHTYVGNSYSWSYFVMPRFANKIYWWSRTNTGYRSAVNATTNGSATFNFGVAMAAPGPSYAEKSHTYTNIAGKGITLGWQSISVSEVGSDSVSTPGGSATRTLSLNLGSVAGLPITNGTTTVYNSGGFRFDIYRNNGNARCYYYYNGTNVGWYNICDYNNHYDKYDDYKYSNVANQWDNRWQGFSANYWTNGPNGSIVMTECSLSHSHSITAGSESGYGTWGRALTIYKDN